jgi:membrane-associated phospholipid phosphatase
MNTPMTDGTEVELIELPASDAAELRFPLGRGIRQAVTLAVVMVGSLSLYLIVLYWRGRHAEIVTRLAWDEWVPFYPAWVWVYLIPYLVGPVLAGLMTPATFWWYIRRGLPVVFVSVAIFAAWPTRTVRQTDEVIQGLGDGLTAQVYRNMVGLDEAGGNAAPSLHVSLTCLLALALARDFPRAWPVWFGGALLVWLATLFTWQHHLLDVLTGALLALAFGLVPGRRPERIAPAS